MNDNINENIKEYIESSNPKNFVQPTCFVCKKDMDCIVETPCEITLHTKCFDEVKDKMKGE